MKARERLARLDPEKYDRVKKQMTCAYYFNGGDCSKGLPGTPCELKGCVAWRLADWAKETYLNENASAIRKVCYKQLIDKIELL